MKFKKKLKKIYINFLWLVKLFRNYLSGDFAYKNYVALAQKNNLNKKILDKKTFLQNKQNSKWKGVNRCC
jgi:uncharacterized short protein YbdD (DUF466 family)